MNRTGEMHSTRDMVREEKRADEDDPQERKKRKRKEQSHKAHGACMRVGKSRHETY